MVGQARHAREHREAAVRAAPDADPLAVGPVLLVQPLDRVVPILQVAAAPVALDQTLVGLAVARRAADVRREHRDAAAQQVLVQRVVERMLLRLRAAVDREDDRHAAVRLTRPVEPSRDLPAVERRVRDRLHVHELVVAEAAADPALRHRPRLAGLGVDDVHLRRRPRAGEDDRGA